MSFYYVPYIWPLITSALVTTTLAVLAWRRRSVRGAKAFLAAALLITAWCLANALEVSGADLDTKLFWAGLQYVSYATMPVCWLAMALDFTGRGRWLRWRRLSYLFIVPAITIALVLTNDLHYLIWSNVHLDTNGPFPIVGKVFGSWFWVHAAYSYIMILGALSLMVGSMINAPGAYRGQFLALGVGTSVPLIWNVAYVFGVQSPFRMDPTPILLGLAGLVVCWGLFRFRIFSLVPIAHRQIIASMEEGIVVLDTDCRVIELNPAAERALRKTSGAVVGLRALELLGAGNGVESLCTGQCSGPAELVLAAAPESRYYELSSAPLFDSTGALLGRLLTLHDITDRKLAEKALKESERRYRELADMLPQPVFEADERMQITFANKVCCESFGYEDDDSEHKAFIADMVVPEDRPRAVENVRRIARGEIIGGQEYMLLRKNGSVFPAMVYSTRVVRNDKFVGLRGIIIDITERKAHEDRLIYARFHDPLTDLCNRAYFDQELQRPSTMNCLPVTIVVTDIDSLKEINDTQGHLAGDEVLKAYSGILKQTFRKSDIVARVGGDEFAFILPWTDTETAEMIHQRLQEQITIHNLTHPHVSLSISWGAETVEMGEINLMDAYRNADLKMYSDKLQRKESGPH